MSPHNTDVKVYVRTKPTTSFESKIIEYLPDKKSVNVCNRRAACKTRANNQMNSWSFRLDGVLHNSSQEEVYNTVAHNAVIGALKGYNGTIMCFGQTGAGKTYTMTGSTRTYKERGIIPRAIQEVFCEVEHHIDDIYSVHISYLEIYNETLVDLLSSIRGAGALTVVEDQGVGVSIKGLSLHQVHTEEEALQLLFKGEMNRKIGEHTLNKNSSRSHCIFTIHIESHLRSNAKYLTSKLNLVDLAGSERLNKIGLEGQLQREALYINRSLSFLEQVILALTDRSREHVPFRQSKLTHALKDSLGGRCNTVLVANIFGEAEQIEETLSTLRFAARMKCLRSKPSLNQHFDPTLQDQILHKEIQHLKQELSLHNALANQTGVSEMQLAEINSQVQRYLAGTLDNVEIMNIKQIKEVYAQFKQVLREHDDKAQKQLKEKQSVVKNMQKMSSFASRTTSIKSKALQPKAKDSSGKDIMSAFGALAHPEPEAPPPSYEPVMSHKTDAAAEKKSSVPPTKTEAFDRFKAGRGSKINSILKQNKTVLLERRDKLHKLTVRINSTKRDIDRLSCKLQKCRKQREREGPFLIVMGEPVLAEAEVESVLQLRKAKDQYRHIYNELVSTKNEVSYCQALVEKCRKRLLAEFECWYNESFLLSDDVKFILKEDGAIRPGLIPMDKALAMAGAEQKQLEQQRVDAPGRNHSAVSFYKAHYRLLQRV